jgi:hypothetical protein
LTKFPGNVRNNLAALEVRLQAMAGLEARFQESQAQLQVVTVQMEAWQQSLPFLAIVDEPPLPLVHNNPLVRHNYLNNNNNILNNNNNINNEEIEPFTLLPAGKEPYSIAVFDDINDEDFMQEDVDESDWFEEK